jgi:hybrid cluster-associated redox disulfide protein
MEDKTMPEITKDTVIGQVLAIAPDAAPIFMGMGMHCLFCPASQGETIEEACAVHGIDPEVLLKELKEFLATQEAK